MVFQVAQHSTWGFVFAIVVLILIVGLITVAVKGKMTDEIMMGGLLATIIFSSGSLIFFNQNDAYNDASFSNQLMAEYHATSSRSLAAIQEDLFRDHEAKDIFTQDGKDTPVFIKLVSRDDKTMTMEFVILDNKSLYPKPAQ